MPFLQDIIGQAESQIKNQVTGVQNSVKNAVGIEVSNLRNTAANTVSNVVSNTVQGAVGQAVNAVSNLAQGNVQEAIQSLNPSNLFDTAFSGIFSSGSSSIQLSDPGYSAVTSSSGGITPGDALQGALARPDPLLNFLWYCLLPVVGAPAGSSSAAPGVTNISNSLSTLLSSVIGGLGSAQGGSVPANTSSQLPWYYIEEAMCPMRSISNMTIFRDGRERLYPLKYGLNGTLSLGIYADVSNTSIQYLQAWQNAVLQPYDSSTLNLGGGWGRPSQYKLPISIFFLDPMKNQLLQLEYVECWPQTIREYALASGPSAERLIHHVDFSAGDVIVSLFNVAPNVTQALVNAGGAVINSTVSSVQNVIGQQLTTIV